MCISLNWIFTRSISICYSISWRQKFKHFKVFLPLRPYWHKAHQNRWKLKFSETSNPFHIPKWYCQYSMFVLNLHNNNRIDRLNAHFEELKKYCMSNASHANSKNNDEKLIFNYWLQLHYCKHFFSLENYFKNCLCSFRLFFFVFLSESLFSFNAAIHDTTVEY